VQSKDMAFIAL